MNRTSFKARIVMALIRVHRDLAGVNLPDHKNKNGRLIGEAFFWEAVGDYAREQNKKCWDTLVEEQIIGETDEIRKLGEGTENVLAESPTFLIRAKISQKVRTFSADALAGLLKKSKFKVPEAVTKQYVEAAKTPGNPRVSLTIEEKGP